MLEQIKKRIMQNKDAITKEEAKALLSVDLQALSDAANEIRGHFCGNQFELCAIVNGKSGQCSENCKYCAQSMECQAPIKTYPLMENDALFRDAKRQETGGIVRYSVVTSGARLSDKEVETLCDGYRSMREKTKLALCASHGLLTFTQFQKLKLAGVTRYHNNLETSRRFFPQICTTHTFDDKVATIKAAQRAGFSVCSGGIMGLGETMEDRIDLALELRALQVTSVPINILNPIQGTPLAHAKPLSSEEVLRIVAIFRFILPEKVLRLAGGRGLLPDQGRAAFCSGINGAISGDLLTTSGICSDTDQKMLKELGYEVALL